MSTVFAYDDEIKLFLIKCKMVPFFFYMYFVFSAGSNGTFTDRSVWSDKTA